jgi:hydroxyethylthiazole kinase-like uncharacterized protein yjeF
MRILFPEEQAEADDLTCRGQGISSTELMERAVSALSEAIRRRFPHALKRVLIVCGPGNNGGDGLALARQLSRDAAVAVFLPENSQHYSRDNLAMLQSLPAEVQLISGSPQDLSGSLIDKTLLIDAVLGAGLNRPLSGSYAALIQQMNVASCLKIAIDTPSGLLPEMPENAIAFKADHVFSFHSPKPAFLLPASEDYVREFSVLDIQLLLPSEKEDDFFFIQEDEIRKLILPRPRFSHKGTFGHALLLAGSEGKMGAAILAAKACLRSGTGLLTVQVPGCGRDILQLAAPEAMVIADPAQNHLSNFPETKNHQAIGTGPGIGQLPETQNVIRFLLSCGKPLVLDADALNLISAHPELLHHLPPNAILTPHPKEFERLSGFSGSHLQRWTAARAFARKHSIFLILKGAFSLICTPDGKAFFNPTGNPGMAKGGSGDALTGLLTGLLASGYSPLSSCQLGTYLHGLAGDLATQSLGSHAMQASDTIRFLPDAWKFLSK